IDGKTFIGRNIQINNGKVIVDGDTQNGELVGDVNVVVNGDVDILNNTNGKVEANNIGQVTTTNGDVICDKINVDVRTIKCNIKSKAISGRLISVNGDICRYSH